METHNLPFDKSWDGCVNIYRESRGAMESGRPLFKFSLN